MSCARGATSANAGWEKAIALVPDVVVEVSWLPYQLDPTIPPEGMDRKAYLTRKFGGPEQIAKLPCAADRNWARRKASTSRSTGLPGPLTP